MTIAQVPQFVPQVIMGGVDFGAMTRDELKLRVVLASENAGLVADAQNTVAFLVDGAKREAEHLDQQALIEGGWVLTADEEDLVAEGLRAQGLEEWKVEAILAGRPI